MSLLAVFGIGQTELIIICVILGILVIPVVIVVAVFAFVAANRNRDDRRQ